MSVMTTTASVDSVKTAYDRLAYFALRAQRYFDPCATVKPTRQAMPGNVVTFTLWDDLSVASTSINESVDIDAAALSDTQASVTLNEYGNAVVTSAKLRGTSFLSVDADAANIVGNNAGETIDELASIALRGGTNVRYAGDATARNTVTPNDTLQGANARRAVAELRGASVMPWANGLYRAFIHPDVSYDFRSDTSTGNWRDPHTYSDPQAIYLGSIGAFEGAEFIEAPRAPKFADAGSSTTLTDVYATLFMGQQALAKAWSSTVSGPLPKVVFGPVVDKLERFHPIGWYFLAGYGRFREAALRRVESASSIGTNA